MNIFVTGGTGALGRPVVQRLVAAGHRVRALARSEKSAAVLRDLDAEPVRADLFDPASLREAVASAEVVLHLATRIPAAAQARRPEAWHENDRIRREGTRNLVDAALAAGVAAFIYPSVVLVYPDSGDRWIDAETSPAVPSTILASTLAAEAEVARFSAQGGRGVVLRMGQFYGDDAYSRGMLRAARRGIALASGDVDAYWSFIWIDDAAAAVVAALAPGVPSGIYDVVDNEPLRRRDLVATLAQAVHRRRLLPVPSPVLRLAGGSAAKVMLRSRRVTNRRFRAVSGWAPQVASARDGWVRLAADLGDRAGSSGGGPAAAERWAKVGLVALLVFGVPIGLWQQLAPRSFYESFPGFGRAWVSPDGPFNEHLVRDLGGLSLALMAIAFMALVRTTPALVRAVALGTLVASVPHLIYHTVNLGVLASTADQVAQTLVLLLVPALALALLWCAERMEPASQARTADGERRYRVASTPAAE